MFLLTLATLLLAGVRAVPLELCDKLPTDVFNITNFAAYSVPHSSWSYLNFNISFAPKAPITNCSISYLSYAHIGDIAETNCTEPTVAFNFTRTSTGGAEFDIFWAFDGVDSVKGTGLIPVEQFALSGTGTTSLSEAYVGPKAFSISNLTLAQPGKHAC